MGRESQPLPNRTRSRRCAGLIRRCELRPRRVRCRFSFDIFLATGENSTRSMEFFFFFWPISAVHNKNVEMESAYEMVF